MKRQRNRGGASTQVHEVDPVRTPLESAILEVAERGMGLEIGRGGKRPASKPERAARLAGIEGSDQEAAELADLIFWAFIYEDSYNRLIKRIDQWGRRRVLESCPNVRVSGREHRKIAASMVAGMIDGESRRQRDRAKAANISDRKLRELMPHISAMDNLLDRGKSLLEAHLRIRSSY